MEEERPIDGWLRFWRDERRYRGCELVVAHPADYADLRGKLMLPEHVRLEWSDGVQPGTPMVCERAATYAGVLRTRAESLGGN